MTKSVTMRSRLLLICVCLLSALFARNWIVPPDNSTSTQVAKTAPAIKTRTEAVSDHAQKAAEVAHSTHRKFVSGHQLRQDQSPTAIDPVRKKFHTASTRSDQLVQTGSNSTSGGNPFVAGLGIHQSELYGDNQRLIGIENNFVSRGDEDTLTASLLSAALDDAYGESTGQVEISFNYTPLPEIQFLSDPSSIGPFTVAYAHLRQSSKCISCILKWEHLNSDQLEFLSIDSLSADQLKTVFVTPANGWQIGTYVFTVYDSALSNRIIGRSSLEIIEINSEMSEIVAPDQYIQSLLANGLATAKTN
ncbi:MAG: hypothetical protein KTR32_13875 [Granulosicoccus sp.]|nr:hypothetical protein [Granulosicoccus sp.]